MGAVGSSCTRFGVGYLGLGAGSSVDAYAAAIEQRNRSVAVWR